MIPKTSKYYHPDQKFVNIESVDIEKLLQEPLLLTCAGSAIRQQINFLTHKFKTNPIIVLESTNIETIASLSAKGIGSTIIPATVAMNLDEGEYNLCPLPQDILSLDYFLAYAKERKLSPDEKDMIETFKKINIIECTQKKGWPKFSKLR
ncbi:transcription regulator [Ligilactobacillus ruminis DPC 6832]|uniref:Transcription regulator n=1 Tax=Ligilactobacillus ruminis DPC 6832 TaxID=1402208 RepID=A0A837DUR8_9LACO|nr:transcription regulator [Ligilactobacillus ruminis DPC 6832]